MATRDAQSGSENGRERVSREALEHLAAVRGEGDEWDFKETLGDLGDNAVRVNLAKDALALSNLSNGGTLIVGIAKDYSRVGLCPHEMIDTTGIRKAIEKYIDGEFTVLAAEHLLADEGGEAERYGIVYFARRTVQPVLAAIDGQFAGKTLFRSGDILIRRGAQSIRANSGDVRRLLTSSVVDEARVKAVDELWECVVAQRNLSVGAETLYDLLVDKEYPEVMARPNLRAMLSSGSELEHLSEVQALQQRVGMVRPYLSEAVYVQYRRWSSFVGRVQMKVHHQTEAGTFRSWTELNDGTPDQPLRQLASQMFPAAQIDTYWAGTPGSLGVHRPLKPVLDLAEHELLTQIRAVLSGLA